MPFQDTASDLGNAVRHSRIVQAVPIVLPSLPSIKPIEATARAASKHRNAVGAAQGRQGQTGQVAGVYGCWMAGRNLEEDAACPQPP